MSTESDHTIIASELLARWRAGEDVQDLMAHKLRHFASGCATLAERCDKLERELVEFHASYRATISHLQGPHSFNAAEPGIYIDLLRVFKDGSFVREFKKVEPDQECYPCKEWRQWHAERDRIHGKF